MAILSIKRDYGDQQAIVRIVTTDNYAAITAPGYLTAQSANIYAANSGAFQWFPTDYVLVNYSQSNPPAFGSGSGWTFLSLSPDQTSLITSGGLLYNNTFISSASFLGMYATSVPILPVADTGRIYVVEQSLLTMTYNSIAYAAGGAIGLQYGSTNHAGGVAATTTIAAASVQGTASVASLMSGALAAAPLATSAAQGLYLTNATAAFTTGNSTFQLQTWYRNVPTVYSAN